ARNLGAKHIAMVGSPNREDAARAAGATAYCSYHTEDMAQVIGEQSDGFDYIIDAVGKRDQINRVLPLLNPRGTIGIYGIDEFYFASVNPRLAQGTFLYYNGGYDEAEAHERVVAFIEDGRLDARIWLNLDGAFPLDDINGAMASIRNRECVKALVRLTETAVS
ncbi:MAG: hypothetical protein QG656_44, partial [Candidatus Hydrogenedentes bacterium]|nr:hypothetical protein [Candidatus Hydrogenedentota bacterium]